MIVNIKDLGKVSVTAEGLHSPSKPYERISIVHDGLYSSYISRKDVPIGIQLSNEEYWQPIASLKEEFRADLIIIRTEILTAIADVIKKLKNSRIVVANESDRNALTINEVAPGCEVYELDTQRTYILDSIVTNTNVKTWHIESDGLIDSEPKYELEGTFDELLADRARCDQFGNVIDTTYLTHSAVNEFIKKSVERHLTNIGAVIQPESIKPNDLSPAVIELLGNRSITNLPDEEDLTSVNKCNGTKVLKFKDKQYVPDSFSGDGIIHLRQYFYANVNVLDQCAINKPNTIYIIKYDFCLYGKTIIVPENVTLDFQGGHILNGTFILNKTKVKGIVGSVYDYLKCDVVGTFLDGQLSYENDKMCCWQTNAFIPICNCDHEEPPTPPTYEQRNIAMYGYNCKVGFKVNNENESVNSTHMISSFSPNDKFTGRVVISNGYEFKGWFKAVYSGRVPPVGEIIEEAVLYSNNETIVVDYNSLIDNQTVCFVAKCEEKIIEKSAIFKVFSVDGAATIADAKIGLITNGETESEANSFHIGNIVPGTVYNLRPIVKSGFAFKGWYKVEIENGTDITTNDMENSTFYKSSPDITITYDNLKADKKVCFIAKIEATDRMNINLHVVNLTNNYEWSDVVRVKGTIYNFFGDNYDVDDRVPSSIITTTGYRCELTAIILDTSYEIIGWKTCIGNRQSIGPGIGIVKYVIDNGELVTNSIDLTVDVPARTDTDNNDFFISPIIRKKQ